MFGNRAESVRCALARKRPVRDISAVWKGYVMAYDDQWTIWDPFLTTDGLTAKQRAAKNVPRPGHIIGAAVAAN
jgi:hypothetical protein